MSEGIETAPLRASRRRPALLVAAIHDRLMSAIADRRLPPGTKLGEDRLAEIFGVSRARVREALLRLAQQRLITLMPNRGAFVTEPSVRETQEICETRRVIEAAIVKAVAEMPPSAKGTARLRDILERERAAWERDDIQEAVRASQGFHLALAEIAGNSILLETLRNILLRNVLSMARYGRPGNPGCLCDEHFQILAAIEEGNVAKAIKLMTHHLDHIEQRMNLVIDDQKVDLAAVLRDEP